MNQIQYIEAHREEAEKRLRAASFAGGQIQFARRTYQVETIEEEGSSWTFVQFDMQNQLSDCFCSCSDSDDDGHCHHMPLSYLRIYGGHERALHERFQDSLWNKLCRICSDRHGYDRDELIHTADGYDVIDLKTKEVFCKIALTPKGKELVQEWIAEEAQETEENSLKFSNLSADELSRWRAGRASSDVLYELSFWMDLAKYMMLIEHNKQPYSIEFIEGRYLPEGIIVRAGELTFTMQLEARDFKTIIPSLASVDSPLKVFAFREEAVEKVRFNPDEGSFSILWADENELTEQTQDYPEEGGLDIGDWEYVPQLGFYSKQTVSFIDGPSIPKEQVEALLNQYPTLFRDKLEDEKVHSIRLHPHTQLSFDKDWNLHLKSYLLRKGDLDSPRSHIFGTWAYIDGQGFYPLRPANFPIPHHVIAEDNIPDFLVQHRSWLSQQKGFSVHFGAESEALTYNILPNRDLEFVALSGQTGKKAAASHSFGEWNYMEGYGFTTRTRLRSENGVFAGLSVKSKFVSDFIDEHTEELSCLQGFFSDRPGILEASVEVRLTEDHEVQVLPKIKMASNKSILYGAYIYAPEFGFSKIATEHAALLTYSEAEVIPEHSLALFLEDELPSLAKVASYVDPRLEKPKQIHLKIDLDMQPQIDAAGGLWASLAYQTEKGTVPATELYKAWSESWEYLFTNGGYFNLNDSRFVWLQKLDKASIDFSTGRIYLPLIELFRLSTVGTDDPALANQLWELLQKCDGENGPNLSKLKSTLRSYQKLGLDWLWFLYRHKLSGLLCDDMGLGKTHQAMALVAAVDYHFSQRKQKAIFLVVCPTSVIFHWEDKLKAFLPHLRVATFHGTQRSLDEGQFDVLLTSYGVLRVENEVLSRLPFAVAIFDEVQIAKNHTSKVHRALRRIQAGMRLGLTGTPIENHLRELKALFDLVLPGYMPQESLYRESYLKPIEKEDSQQVREVLRRLIAPFIMRRRKEEVLQDLPEKTEEISHCTLSEEQVRLYNEMLMQSRESILATLERGEEPPPFLHIFALLNSLKQICDHPAVALKTPQDFEEHDSGKWKLFVEILNQAQESGQKVVVFSQYLNMLDIIELHCERIGLGYAAVRGSTTKREDEFRRFQDDPDCRVFVGSLQAVGLGVDLTAASVVIHYDRWWNAARENQATDRVHRIGQTRGVQVFKLVTLGTIEERIDELISKKAQLMDDVVQSSDEGLIRNMSRDDLLNLLGAAKLA